MLVMLMRLKVERNTWREGSRAAMSDVDVGDVSNVGVEILANSGVQCIGYCADGVSWCWCM